MGQAYRKCCGLNGPENEPSQRMPNAGGSLIRNLSGSSSQNLCEPATPNHEPHSGLSLQPLPEFAASSHEQVSSSSVEQFPRVASSSHEQGNAAAGIAVEEVQSEEPVQSSQALKKSKEEYAREFIPLESCKDKDWLGILVDLFSPDDTNPDSRRFIDLDEAAGELQVSADTGGEKWGRRFDKETSVNPVLAATETANTRKTSFLSKVPADAPIYEEAKAGALNFTLVLGTAFGKKVIKWNGLYDGKGGKFGGNDVPASDCDNFWEFV